MNVVLSELVFDKWEIVWTGSISAPAVADEQAILDRAFDAVLFNYIGGCFPEGFGLRTDIVSAVLPNTISRVFHCSGRNVKINYHGDGMIVENKSVRDRDFRVDITK